MSKYTPGPWKLNHEPNLQRIEIFRANAVGSRLQGKQVAVVQFHTLNTAPDEANARLIAAAPELLDLAKRALDFIRVTPEPRLVHTREDLERWLTEVIAKAEGDR